MKKILQNVTISKIRLSICLYLSLSLYIYIYIYKKIERETSGSLAKRSKSSMVQCVSRIFISMPTKRSWSSLGLASDGSGAGLKATICSDDCCLSGCFAYSGVDTSSRIERIDLHGHKIKPITETITQPPSQQLR